MRAMWTDTHKLVHVVRISTEMPQHDPRCATRPETRKRGYRFPHLVLYYMGILPLMHAYYAPSDLLLSDSPYARLVTHL
jgi:hypothetical protein